MNWLRNTLVRLALARPDAALIKAAGGEPRTVRGMTLDARMQFLEAQARKRGARIDLARFRAQTEAGSEIFSGGKVAGVRAQPLQITGRSYTVPARLYLPTRRDNRAAMLAYFHAGGGVIGSLESCDRLCALIAKEASAPVLSVDYRLAPEFKFPTGYEDCRSAYLWAVENAARYGAPAGKVGVGGDSMGAGFAALIAQEFRATKSPVVQLLIYPGLDFVNEAPSMHDFADAWPLTAEVAQFFLEQYLPDGVDPSDARVSPGRANDVRGVAPALIFAAGFDMLLDQGAAYAERLRTAGVKTSYTCFESLPHGFVMFPGAAPASLAAIARIARETAVSLKAQG